MTVQIFSVVALFAGIVLTIPPPKAIAEDFYKGKTLRLIVMTAPGGGYDTYARAIARHLGNHIPGNPSVIVQNIPGGGGLIATHHLYNVAKPDGLTIGMVNAGIIVWQAVGMEQIRYDTSKFKWIGTPGEALPVCAVMGFTGITNFDQLLKSEKPLNFGSAGTSTYQQPMLLRLLFNANVSIVEGYVGTGGIRAAMQRREVDAACWQWDSMKATAKEMLSAEGQNRLIPVLIEGRADDPEVRDLPQYSDFIKGEENVSLFNAWLSQYKLSRPLVAPPGTPQPRLEILRTALKRTLVNPQFRTLADKMQLDINHVPGETIERYVNETLSISPRVKEKLRPVVLR